MKSHETLQETPEKELHTETKNHRQTPQPPAAGSQWQFKVLITVISLCVLMLVGKIFGLF